MFTALYDSTGGPGWTDADSWVIGLDLFENQLSGMIPSELGNLTNLQGLGLNGNELNGMLPSSLTNLRQLRSFLFRDNPRLCAPLTAAFQGWLGAGIIDLRGPVCGP